MDAQGVYSGFAFSRNPVILSEAWKDTYDPVDEIEGGSVVISIGDSVIYRGRFSPPLSMDVSEILAANIPYLPELSGSGSSPVVELDGGIPFDMRRVLVTAEFGGVSHRFDFTALQGGIPSRLYRRLVEAGTDIFKERFLNKSVNPFLSMRSAGSLLVIKESEIYPLYFFITGGTQEVRLVSLSGGHVLKLSLSVGAYALDLDALRRYFLANGNTLSNAFEFYRGDIPVCRIVVALADDAKDRCRIKFRNSFGVYEIIDLTGSVSVSMDQEGNDSSEFLTVDSITRGLCAARDRRSLPQSINVESGAKSPDEIRLIADMLCSEDVWLLDVADFPVKVIPSVNSLEFMMPQRAPESFNICLKLCDKGDVVGSLSDYLPDGSAIDSPEYDRIFTDQFTDHFC